MYDFFVFFRNIYIFGDKYANLIAYLLTGFYERKEKNEKRKTINDRSYH